MKSVIIIAIVIPIVFGIIAVLVILSMLQQNLESDEEQHDEIIWQKLQKTYLMQKCREKYIGQDDEMEKCFEQIDEEQRLNPPTSPKNQGLKQNAQFNVLFMILFVVKTESLMHVVLKMQHVMKLK